MIGLSFNLHQVAWQDWLQGELRSLPLDQRVEMLVWSIQHNNLTSLIAARDGSVQTRFRLAEQIRDVADELELGCERRLCTRLV
jgi:hypothetical protein